ncbi:hypothetical protein E2C01_022986 [Portunus trituberculatus]|uniref:Uncharacterized protein n=1 Tax=Portunus trituberculatus TaxID=210409 RepID=A0A5B7E8Q5_PORTR|nr:hypothetical protein [Portunus trituberculatus]
MMVEIFCMHYAAKNVFMSKPQSARRQHTGGRSSSARLRVLQLTRVVAHLSFVFIETTDWQPRAHSSFSLLCHESRRILKVPKT